MAFNFRNELVERFHRYTAIPTQSKSGEAQVPSTPGQWDLAKLLVKELEELGLIDVELSEYCVVTAKLPSNTEKKIPAIGFCSHLDTVDINLSPEVHAQLVHYEGGDLCLNDADNIYIRESDHPELKKYVGEDIFVSDGHSVLGADDKASISSVMTALSYWQSHTEVKHGDIYIVFVPDEEVGLLGSKKINFDKFPVEFAYTLDSCELGEVVYETFNAGTGKVTIKGVSAHPMSAKGVLVNPTLVGVDLINMFNRLETPENTSGHEGYIWIQEFHSNQTTAQVILNIRDHDKSLYEAKKDYIKEAVSLLQLRYPKAEITLDLNDIYGNINDAISEKNQYCIDYIYQAMEELNIEPKTIAMRGGTDGSFISTKGIPTPNFFTGGHNFHSYTEFLPLCAFEKSCKMILKIVEIINR